jgi:hypothetical protein
VRNCATALSGPVVATPPPPAPSAVVAAARPTMRGVAAVRVRAKNTAKSSRTPCRDCVRVSFTAGGSGPLTWNVRMTAPKAGVKTAQRKGRVSSGRRVTALLPLSRVPLCGARLSLSLSVSSTLGTVRSTRRVAISRPCRRR